MNQHVKMTVTCASGHVVGTYTDEIAEKYPFYCEECGDTLHGRYPWKITAEIVTI